jgi:cytidylate kinase
VENLKLKKIKSFILTVDGKSSSGKSTAAKLLSKKFKIPHLSSGLLYRWAAKIILDNKPKNKISYLKKRFKKFNYNNIKKINLHSPNISEYTAKIAKILEIRKIIKKAQKNWVHKNNKHCVVEGRDSHTIFPQALVKFYLRANLNTAALRRFKELKRKNRKITIKEVKKDLRKRDYSDTTRKHSPLILAKDHVVIRSDILNKPDMVKKMSKKVEEKLVKKYGVRNKSRNKR